MFDWGWLDLPEWSPLSALPTSVRHVTGGLYEVDPCMFVLTGEGEGPDAECEIGAFLWARSKAVAVAIYELTPDVLRQERGRPCPRPPLHVLGIEPLTYGGVMAHFKSSGERLMITASYRFTDGLFLKSEIVAPGYTFYFVSANPPDDEQVIAIQFDL